MPIATPEVYAEMLDKAKRESFAYPAINVSSSQTLNAALQGFAEAGSDGFVRPLLDVSIERVKAGQAPLFQSHMWDGSAVPLEENLQIAQELLEKAAAARIILEIEVGVVGGEEDGVVGGAGDKLYSTPEDALATVAARWTGETGR